MFLAPATAALALSIYSQWEVLKKNFLPILAGTLTGSLTSIVSVLVLCKLFGLSDELTASMIPKSVTTPIAMEISKQQGGIVSITVAAVIVTGYRCSDCSGADQTVPREESGGSGHRNRNLQPCAGNHQGVGAGRGSGQR